MQRTDLRTASFADLPARTAWLLSRPSKAHDLRLAFFSLLGGLVVIFRLNNFAARLQVEVELVVSTVDRRFQLRFPVVLGGNQLFFGLRVFVGLGLIGADIDRMLADRRTFVTAAVRELVVAAGIRFADRWRIAGVCTSECYRRVGQRLAIERDSPRDSSQTGHFLAAATRKSDGCQG